MEVEKVSAKRLNVVNIGNNSELTTAILDELDEIITFKNWKGPASYDDDPFIAIQLHKKTDNLVVYLVNSAKKPNGDDFNLTLYSDNTRAVKTLLSELNISKKITKVGTVKQYF